MAETPDDGQPARGHDGPRLPPAAPDDEPFARGHDGALFEISGGRLSHDEFDDLLIWCADRKVSDISVQSGDHVWAEVGGSLVRVTRRRITHPEVSAIVRSIYGDNGPGMVNSGEDLDFAYEFKLPTRRMRFRINVTCGRMIGGRGFQITARTLPSKPLRIEEIGMEPEILENLRPPQGLNLVTGPTGSGKSTTLSSLVRWRCEQPGANEKVLEYSRPVEYVYDNLVLPNSFIHQVDAGDHLHSRSGDTEESVWAYCVRNALRRKPTLILIGEARDRATIQGCIEAALTGHLVMSTMHTIGVPETVRRAMMPFSALERRGIAVDLLECLNLIVTQLLLPRAGGGKVACREYMVVDRKVRAALMGADPDEWPARLRTMLNERRVTGSTMAASAQTLLGRDLITPETYEWIAARTSSESKVVREAISGGMLSRSGEFYEGGEA